MDDKTIQIGKPCPFCGCSPIMVEADEERSVQCSDPECVAGDVGAWSDAAGAWAAWNRRTDRVAT